MQSSQDDSVVGKLYGLGQGVVAVIEKGPQELLHYVAQKFESLKLIGGSSADRIDIGSLKGTSIENNTIYFDGGLWNDIFNARFSDRRVVAEGGKDDDLILGGSSNDELSGGAGADTLDGGLGDDMINGGSGLDIASYEAAGAGVAINLIAGAAMSGGAVKDTLISIEGAKGSAFNDLFYGDAAANLFSTGGGIDVAYGGGGNDTIELGDGNDAAAGEAGNDVIFGDDGTEYLYGGDGNDILYGQSGVDFLFGESGDDAIYGGIETDGISGGTGDDYIFGEAGIDYLFGDAGNDYVYGGAEYDFIYGGEGVDALFDEGGGDFLAGEGGTDYIAGGDGDDYIYGGDGVDFLYGQAGNDVFAGGLGMPDAFYHDGFIGGNDLVLDFEAGLDVLVLLGTGYTSAAQAIANASYTGDGTTLFTGAGASITLFGISVADLSAGNVFIG